MYNILPGPRGTLIGGSIKEIKRKGILDFYGQQWRSYGDCFQVRFAHKRIVVLVHPHHAHEVLLEKRDNYIKGASHDGIRLLIGDSVFTANNERWAKQRRVMRDSFTMQSINNYVPIMARALQHTCARLGELAASLEYLDLSREMRRFTLRALSESLFGTASFVGDLSVETPVENFGIRFIERTNQATPLPLWVPTRSNREFKAARTACLARLTQLMEMSGSNHDAEGTTATQKLLLHRLKDSVASAGPDHMTARQAFDEFITMYFAGHETTANALTWIFYLLDQHEDVREKLLRELDAQELGEAPNMNDLSALPYTHMVIAEALRLYPPAWVIARDTVMDDVIGGYRIPKGSVVLTTPYFAHRHPDFWQDPELFCPERFAGESARKTLKEGYMPFGHGQRICLGNLFSLVEIKLAVAILAKKFLLRLKPGLMIREEARVVLVPDKPLEMSVETRG